MKYFFTKFFSEDALFTKIFKSFSNFVAKNFQNSHSWYAFDSIDIEWLKEKTSTSTFRPTSTPTDHLKTLKMTKNSTHFAKGRPN